MAGIPGLFRGARRRVKSWLNPDGGQFLPNFMSFGWWQEGYSKPVFGPNSISEACILAYAQTLAMTPLLHYRERDDNGRDYLRASDIAKLLRNPNAYQTRSDLFLNLAHSLYRNGNAYLYLGDRESSARLPNSLHLLNPDLTRGYWVETGEVFYAISKEPWTSTADIEASSTIPARDIAHFKLHTPRDFLIGQTPISAAAASIAANDAISASQAAFFANMSRPSGFLKTDTSYRKEQMEQLREQWEKQSVGLNQGKVPILAGDLSWESITITNQDAQLIEFLKMTIADISRCFRVPLPIINALEGATFNNSEALINFWLSSGLGFLLSHVEQVLEKAFGLAIDEHLDFDTKALLRPDFKVRMESIGTAIEKGIYSPNEGRAIEGLSAWDSGQEPRLQAQVVPYSYYEKELALRERQASAAGSPAPNQAPKSAALDYAARRAVAISEIKERLKNAAA